MSEPFPGMDPFLEGPADWRDFHHRFITYWRDVLTDHLPDHYDVRIDERAAVLEEDGSMERLEGKARPPAGEPVRMRVRYLPEAPEPFVRVTYQPDGALVAVLELLSPTSKEAGRPAYLTTRNERLDEPVHLVELDLLLGGKRLPMKGKWPAGDYFALVSRGDHRPESEVYGWHLREPLPRIRLPLKAPDPDLVFDLPGLFAQAYRRGRYTRALAYDQPPPVALAKENAEWVAERLRAWRQADK